MTTETMPRLSTPRTSKEAALKAVTEAEMKLAEAMRAIADAIAAGEIKPCACYYIRFASAQSDMEGTRKEITGERKGDRIQLSSDDARSGIVEALMRAAVSS